METYNSIYEIARVDFIKRGWSVNPLHRLSHESELRFQVIMNTEQKLTVTLRPIVAEKHSPVDITLKLYMNFGELVVETSIPPRKRLLLPDVAYPVNEYILDTEYLPPSVVLGYWRDLWQTDISSLGISPTLGIGRIDFGSKEKWLRLGFSKTGSDAVVIPTEEGTSPPATDTLGVIGRLNLLCEYYQAETTDFGRVVWLQYLIAKFCNFYCRESNEITRKTLLHILSTKVDFRPTVRSDGDHWYVLDLDQGLSYRFCYTHPYRAHTPGMMVTEELDEKFPSETLRTYLHGTLVSERRLSQLLDKDFRNLLEYARLPDCDVIPWVEFCKLHYGEYGFSALVESRPEYQIVRHLNKEKK